MKRLKRLTALVLSAVCVCALIATHATAAVSTFPDVADPQVGRAVEALRMMGVIDGGDGGYFFPDQPFSRAQFCKLAVLIMGKGNEALALQNRTIFADVTSSHWARGYVNLAATTTVGGGEKENGQRLMIGVGDGTFAPDRAVTCGEAVTVALRILGYGKQAAAHWPYGALSTAESVGLIKGLDNTSPFAALNRAQAALMFYNLLLTPVSGSPDSIYAATLGSVKTGMMLLSLNATTPSGQKGAVQFFDKTGKQTPILPSVHAPASFLLGMQGSAVVNKEGRLVTFLPEPEAKVSALTVSSATKSVLTTSNGEKLSMTASTKVWYNGEEQTYEKVYTELNREGAAVTVCYTAAGAVDYLVADYTAMSSAKDGAAVAREAVVGNPFGTLTQGASDYKIIKNGSEITTSGIKQYDVGTFHADSNTLYICDFRLHCVFVDAQPNLSAPTSITISAQLDGKDKLDVLECAVPDLQKCKPGDVVTLLFAADGKVAGAVSASQARGNAIGILDRAQSSDTSAVVNLVGAPFKTISGKFSGKIRDYSSDLLQVSASSKTALSLARLSTSNSSKLNLKAGTLGKQTLADKVYFFERVGSGEITQIKREDITVETVAADKVLYRHLNYAGQVDAVVLNDVTGDRYTYGIAKAETKAQTDDSGSEENGGNSSTSSLYISVTNQKGTVTTLGGRSFKNGQFIGLAASAASVGADGSTPRLVGSVALKSVKSATPVNFNLTSGRFFSGSVELPIWEGVQCYNAKTKSWFSVDKKENETDAENAMRVLNACLDYSSNLTVYYDRDPNQGGKVRIVVAN